MQKPGTYQPYERPSMIIAYVVGCWPIRGGTQVGLDEEGLLVPINLARCFVGIANESREGEPEPRHNACVNVTSLGSFVMAFVGWAPTLHDLQRAVWAFDETSVSGCPLRTDIPVGRIVGLERTDDAKPGVRVKIDAATNRCLPPLPGKVQEAREWHESIRA